MKNNRISYIAAAFGLVLTMIVATGASAEPDAPSLTASVVSQQCQGGDGVNVTLTAVLSPARSGVTFAWDFNGDGILDTAPDANPTVTTTYPDEFVASPKVFVMKGARTKASDSVTFETVRCP